MMQNLQAIYDAAFFGEWGSGNADYVASAEVITDELCAQFKPGRVADIGCGCGVYSHLFRQRGIDVLSLDGVMPPPEHAFPVTIHQQDLTEPFENVWGKYDFTLCMEVAEHIPEPLVGVFLENLVRFGDTLIMSAAPPRQGGHHHVNEQPKRCWVEKLAGLGFLYSRRKTGRLFDALCVRRMPLMWMMQQISIYERRRPAGRKGEELPFGVRFRS